VRNTGNYITGGWWKFSRYEIRGANICPSFGATLEWYDPWDRYRISVLKKDVPRPYEDLLRLFNSIAARHQERSTQDKVLEWCSEYGLLGSLPQVLQRVQSVPRWVENPPGCWIEYCDWVRIGEHWHPSLRYRPANVAIGARDLFRDSPLPLFPQAGAPITKDHAAWETPCAFYSHTADGYDFNAEPPMIETSRLIASYFPRCHDTDAEPFDCPIPATRRFWQLYTEPYTGFLGEASRFCSTISAFLERSGFQDLTSFQKYLAPLSMALEKDEDGKLQERWSSPSLLCTFARMAYQDLAASLTLKSCECCHRPFITDNQRTHYCSQNCGWRLRKRKARSRKPTSSQESSENAKTTGK
jgi:hypothetical protein